MVTRSHAPHEDLRAWQACYRLAVEVYKVSRNWPRDERYGLTAQVRSAAYSAGANIAEGLAREGPRELHRFLSISLGSLAELGFALRLAREIGVIPPTEWEPLEAMRHEAGLLTGSLAKAIRRQR
ncbi:MAG: four helix bundle protein [Gemmatimonadota bacterium]|nr:four helix bundle protein [Gemmatimonadota bacterium]